MWIGFSFNTQNRRFGALIPANNKSHLLYDPKMSSILRKILDKKLYFLPCVHKYFGKSL